MIRNAGKIDRAIRAAIGVALIAAALSGLVPFLVAGIAKYIAIAVGVVMLGVAISGVCPLYSLIGISTCKRDAAS